ncbi:cobyrinic acid a,c-diamide synthase, partial [Pseudomonadota bacterium]
IKAAGRAIARHVDLAALQALAQGWDVGGVAKPLRPLGNRIAVAHDEAFAFAYPQVLDGWRAQGAEISFFSPLDDQAPNARADAVFLPGGYPELHAYRLSSADRFMNALRDAAKAGKTIYGECGGYMVLGRGMQDADGTNHAMAGLLPLGTTFEKRKLHLGYRQLVLIADTPLGPVHAKFRGHEFHYASVTSEGPGKHLFDAYDSEGAGLGKTGLVADNVFGSFVHLIDRETKT